MAFPAAWTAIKNKHMARVPKGAGFGAYQAAMRAASAEYHGGRKGRRANPAPSRRRRNPEGNGNAWKWLLAGAAALILLPRMMGPRS